MKQRAISKVVIEASGRLLVCPKLSAEPSNYEYIYREANGLRWDRQENALHAYEPTRWKHEELLMHIAATLRVSCDEDLIFDQDTQWVGVQPEIQQVLRQALVVDRDHERDV